jgi:hypothetical protein
MSTFNGIQTDFNAEHPENDDSSIRVNFEPDSNAIPIKEEQSQKQRLSRV